MRAPKTETELRKEQIIKAAMDLIGTEGVFALSIAGIAERVGIVPSAIYRHFNSKDAVLDAVLDLLKSRLMENIVQVRKESPGALQRLHSLLMRHIRLLQENRAIPYVVFSDGFYTGNPGRRAKVAEVLSAYLGKIQEIVEEGKQQGAIRQDLAPATVSAMFMGMILPAAVLWNVSEGHFDLVKHADRVWPVFAGCIEAPNP